MEWLAWVLIGVAPLGVYIGYRYLRAALVDGLQVDAISVSAIREVASGISGVIYAILGVNILTGRWLHPAVALFIFVAAVFIDRLSSLPKLWALRRWDQRDREP